MKTSAATISRSIPRTSICVLLVPCHFWLGKFQATKLPLMGKANRLWTREGEDQKNRPILHGVGKEDRAWFNRPTILIWFGMVRP